MYLFTLALIVGSCSSDGENDDPQPQYNLDALGTGRAGTAKNRRVDQALFGNGKAKGKTDQEILCRTPP